MTSRHCQTLGRFSLFLPTLLGLTFAAACSESRQGNEIATVPASAPADTPTSFRPLGPGAVAPSGWLRDWAQAAAEGITGDLDTRAETFRMAYLGKEFEARGVQPGGAGWPLEQAAYWLDGLVRLAYILNDRALIEKAQSRLDPVVDGVLNGGESFFYWLPKDRLDNTFNNWAHSHMGRALVAYYEATQEPRILEALVKVYRDYPLPDMVLDFHPVNGAVNLDPMLDTFALSGDEQVLRNAMEYAGRPGFREIVNHWTTGDYAEGHTVITYENMRVPALLFPWTRDRRHLEATEAALDWGHKTHGLPVGLLSGEEFVAGIGSTRNVETCNVAAGAWTYTWMLRITGEASFGDRLERVFFNAGPGPVARDFQTMAYYQSPNRFSKNLPEDRPMHPGGDHDSYSFTEIGHEVLCCIGNLNRVIPNYIMHMWMATPDQGLAATLYGPATVRAKVADGVPVEISADTQYPFEDTIRLTLKTAKQVSFPLYVRLPEWSANPVAEINGAAVRLTELTKGFAKIERAWNDEDLVTLRFPMAVTVEHGVETDYPTLEYYEREGRRRLARERGIRNPFASIFYGPLLFALPIPDDGGNRVAGSVDFNYALDILPGTLPKGTNVERQPMPSRWRWKREESPLRLQVPARTFPWEPNELQPLPPKPVSGGEKAVIQLVPYGVTKFRVSMFPVTASMWQGLAR